MVLILLVFVLWAVGRVQQGVLRVRWSPLYLPFLAFLLVATFQLFKGMTFDHLGTREALLKLITNFLIFFLAGQLLFSRSQDGRFLEWFGLMVTVLMFSLSVLAIAQVMTTGHGLIYWTVSTAFGPFGPYVSANDYCGLLEMLIPISVGYILSGYSPKVPRLAVWLAVGVALASVVISGSRGGSSVILIEFLLFGLIIFRYRSQGTGHLSLPLILILVLGAVGAFGGLSTGSRWTDRALSAFQTDKSIQVKMGDRLWVAEDTLRMARHHPWLGIGVGAFETAFPPYMTHPSNLHWTHAHDDFAEGLAETGVVGGVLILWGLGIFFFRAFFQFPERLQDEWGWITIGAVVGATGLLCHSLVDFNLRVPANAAWFVVVVAVATQSGALSTRSSRGAREPVPARKEGFLN
jgi:O-antigen ligase